MYTSCLPSLKPTGGKAGKVPETFGIVIPKHCKKRTFSNIVQSFAAFAAERSIRIRIADDTFNDLHNIILSYFIINDMLCAEVSLIRRGLPIFSNIYATDYDNSEIESFEKGLFKLIIRDLENHFSGKTVRIHIPFGFSVSGAERKIKALSSNSVNFGGDIKKIYKLGPIYFVYKSSGPSMRKRYAPSRPVYLDHYKSDEFATEQVFSMLKSIEASGSSVPAKIRDYNRVIKECDLLFGYHLRTVIKDRKTSDVSPYLYHSGFRSELLKKYCYFKLYECYDELNRKSKASFTLINYFFNISYLMLPSTLEEIRIVEDYEDSNRCFSRAYKRARYLRPLSFVTAFVFFIPAFIVHEAGGGSRAGDSLANDLASPSTSLVKYARRLDKHKIELGNFNARALSAAVNKLQRILEENIDLQDKLGREIEKRLNQLWQQLKAPSDPKALFKEFNNIHRLSQELGQKLDSLPLDNGKQVNYRAPQSNTG